MYKYLANTVFTGKNIIYLPSCHSTNDIARQHIQDNKASEGTIVITDNQISGKGQRGNKWQTEAGENLTFSLIYCPAFLSAEDTFWLNIIISISIHQALKNYGITTKIKWPNDIMVGNKKLGGILIENIMDNRKICHSIIGIGLNVNQRQFSIPYATSIYNITNRFYKLENLLHSIAASIEQFYLRIKNGGYDDVKLLYLKNLFGIDEVRPFEVKGEMVTGTIKGIDNAGRLKVEIAGQTNYFSFKEIKYILE